jgi:cell cycle serine/threonine-protein kinase CDC5/MSD2
LLGAVKYMHDRKIYHRDLKLVNIMIDELENILLADFGATCEEPLKPVG